MKKIGLKKIYDLIYLRMSIFIKKKKILLHFNSMYFIFMFLDLISDWKFICFDREWNQTEYDAAEVHYYCYISNIWWVFIIIYSDIFNINKTLIVSTGNSAARITRINFFRFIIIKIAIKH